MAAVPEVTELAAEVVARCRSLAEVSAERGRLTRPYASHAMAQANAMVAGWMQDAGLIARMDHAVGVQWRPRLDNPAVAVDPGLTEHLAAAVAALGHDIHRMPSGAGHDGVAITELTGIAMLFVRCAGGLSHHPQESVAEADVAVALDVVDGFLSRLAAQA